MTHLCVLVLKYGSLAITHFLEKYKPLVKNSQDLWLPKHPDKLQSIEQNEILY